MKRDNHTTKPDGSEGTALTGTQERPRPRVLVVDEEDTCRRCQEELENEGYDVIVAHDGETAVDLAVENTPDAVVMEVQLPERIDGLEAMSKMLSEKGSLPVILHTYTDQYKRNFMSWSASDYIVKSEGLSALKESLRHIVG